MQEINQVGMPLELNCQEISQGLSLPCEHRHEGELQSAEVHMLVESIREVFHEPGGM